MERPIELCSVRIVHKAKREEKVLFREKGENYTSNRFADLYSDTGKKNQAATELDRNSSNSLSCDVWC